MKLKIYNQTGELKTTVSPSDNSTLKEGIMEDCVLNLSFTLPEHVSLEVNDYIDYEEQRYTLLSNYEPIQKSTLEYEYAPKFYSIIGELRKAIVVFDENFETEFNLDGNPGDHIKKIVDNINRIKGTNEWTVGSVIDAPNQTIEYRGKFCIDALTDIAKTFDTEWWVENRTINLCRCEHGNPVELGYLNGLKDMGKKDAESDVRIITRLIPLGSTRNIDKNKYGHSRLQLPDRAKYIERNIQYGIYEAVEEDSFAGIYPHRTGTITSIRTENKIGDNDKRFIVYYFVDSELNFNPNDYELSGLVKHIIFQNGDLNGKDFEVNYNSDTNEFEIINQYPNDGEQLPGGRLIPKDGDTYILYNISMPDSYYPIAEKEYQIAVNNFLQKYSEDASIYKGNTDYINLDKRGIYLSLGRRVRLLNDKYFKETGYRDSRIVSITRNVTNPSQMYIECSYAVGQGRVSAMASDISDLKTRLAEQENTTFTILKTWDSVDPTNYNVLSSLRTLREILNRALSRLNDDESSGHILFKKGSTIENGLIVRRPKQDSETAMMTGLVEEKTDLLIEEDNDSVMEIGETEESPPQALSLGELKNVTAMADALDESNDYVLVKQKGATGWTLLSVDNLGGGIIIQ